MLRRLWIRNYKAFGQFDLTFKDGLNLLVGDNEVGKSTVLEAVHLALTRRLNGRSIDQELTSHLFTRATVEAYVASVRGGAPEPLPTIEIELYFDDADDLAPLRGTMNHAKEDACGIRVEVSFDDDYAEEYAALVKDRRSEVDTVPAEYYGVHWRSFAGNAITARSLDIGVSYVDATTIRLQSGTDFYIQDIIRSDLDVKERVALNLAYRRLKETFSGEAAIQSINQRLSDRKGAITDKDLAISIDTSQRANWETSLVPHLDKLPFQLVGKGEQNALKIILALERKAGDADVILVEEPENHLSFSSMTRLLARMQEKCAGKQIIVTTHSAYVLNKLGLGRLLLLGPNGTVASLSDLSPETQEYFEKLSGYDTLRLVLAKKAILVEGPSDELVVQRAYRAAHGHLPIDDGVDVISVRGLSFLRFLEIAQGLQKEVRVVTDNDGDFARVDAKYLPYESVASIQIHRSDDNSAPTLEPQLLKANSREALNELFGTSHKTDEDLLAYMKEHKTDCALRIFKAPAVNFPQYIVDAVA